MKDFMEQQLWLATWHFFILVLNSGVGAVKKINHYKTPISHIISLRLKADQQQEQEQEQPPLLHIRL